MYYVCIENEAVVGIQGYEPSVPGSVTVITITDNEHQQLMNRTHKFDITTKTVIPIEEAILNQREQEKLNAVEREFLNSTDWKIMRHIRQKALTITTTLTDAEYLELEQQRQAAAARIV